MTEVMRNFLSIPSVAVCPARTARFDETPLAFPIKTRNLIIIPSTAGERKTCFWTLFPESPTSILSPIHLSSTAQVKLDRHSTTSISVKHPTHGQTTSNMPDHHVQVLVIGTGPVSETDCDLRIKRPISTRLTSRSSYRPVWEPRPVSNN